MLLVGVSACHCCRRCFIVFVRFRVIVVTDEFACHGFCSVCAPFWSLMCLQVNEVLSVCISLCPLMCSHVLLLFECFM